ncbi:hypothetical protein FEM48_Zijuj01G0096700 [Ziziphus jujuba var. spinosa]|uniref:Amino acid transporter transmembrane domain-containing protein n=1 Tax=Ziziphus jujuba var. spinosa TaxID=714518 RepID=A0A978W0I1_ZIZJJ|nr:hypothetical protein FEM48_Zijuj01G0096700 [Ziziphus jujuba var. spinosa]
MGGLEDADYRTPLLHTQVSEPPLIRTDADDQTSLLHAQISKPSLIRTGNVWTAVAHIITGVIGSGALSVAWSMAQLGWIAGPLAMLFFPLINLTSAFLLSNCYRSPDPEYGLYRNRTYLEAVHNYLGNVWTAVAHIITGVIGSGVLSLAWSMAQLGWIAGPLAMILFALVTLMSAFLLCNCYLTPDPEYGPHRNISYLEAVRNYLDADYQTPLLQTQFSESSLIRTGVIGSGVLSLAWSLAQLGWIAGPLAMLSFALVTLISGFLLCNCYRFPDPEYGPLRNRSYLEAVHHNLGKVSL